MGLNNTAMAMSAEQLTNNGVWHTQHGVWQWHQLNNPAAFEFGVGKRVKIFGLNSSPHYNDTFGTIKEQDVDNNRWGVGMDYGSGWPLEKLEIKNLEVQPPSADGRMIFEQTEYKGESGLLPLLRVNADINTPDINAPRVYQRGYTALHYAAGNGALRVATLLVANKADLDLKDKDGQTPLESAEEYARNSAGRGHTQEEYAEVAAFLREQRRVAQANKEQEAPRAVVALDADIHRISRLKQAQKWFQEHGVIEFFDDAVKQLGLTGPGDIEFLERADLEAIGMPALKVRRVLGAAKKAKSG